MSETQNLFVELHALVSYAPSNLNRDDLGAPKTAVFGGVRRLRISSQCQKRSWRMADIFKRELAAEEGRRGERTAHLGDVVRELLANDTKLKEEERKLAPDEQEGFDALLESIGKKKSAGESKDKKEGAAEEPEDTGDAEKDGSEETAHLLYLSKDEQAAVAAFVKEKRKALAEIGKLRAKVKEIKERLKAEARPSAEAPKPEAPKVNDEARAKGARRSSKRAAKPADDPELKTKVKDAEQKLDELRKNLRDKHMVNYVPRSAVDVALFGRFLTESEFREIDAAMQVAHAIGTQKAEVEYDYFTAMDDRSREAAAGHIGETEIGASVFYKYAACDTALLCKNLGPSAEEAKHAEGNAKEHPQAKEKVDAHRANARDVAARALKGIAFAVARVVPTGKQNSTAPQSPADYLEVVVRRDAPVSLVNAFLKPVQAMPRLLLKT